MHLRSNRGFTLVEMIAAMALVVIMASIALPRLGRALQGSVVRGGLEEFAAAHGFARSTAVQYGRTVRLHIDPTTREVWVEADTTMNIVGTLQQIGPKIEVANEDLTMTSSVTVFCFDGLGTASGEAGCPTSPATIVFSAGSRTDSVRILLSGKLLR